MKPVIVLSNNLSDTDKLNVKRIVFEQESLTPHESLSNSFENYTGIIEKDGYFIVTFDNISADNIHIIEE